MLLREGGVLLLTFLFPYFVNSNWLNENIENNTLLDGDIDVSSVLNRQTINSANNELDSALKCDLWPNGVVPYVIKDKNGMEFSEIAKKYIQLVMLEFNYTTCVQFVQRKLEANYIQIELSSICSSSVGFQRNGSQIVKLAPGCLTRNDILHELMHVLGFIHEQNRPDRDEFVEVRMENVGGGKAKNFIKRDWQTVTNLNTEYDFNSVMHYPKNAFSKNGRPTIVPKRPDVTIEPNGLSPTDILRINRLYNCAKEPVPYNTVSVDLQSVYELVAVVKRSDWQAWELVTGGERQHDFYLFNDKCNFKWTRGWYNWKLTFDGFIYCDSFPGEEFKKSLCSAEICSFNEPFKLLLIKLAQRKRIPEVYVLAVVQQYREFTNNDKRETTKLIES